LLRNAQLFDIALHTNYLFQSEKQAKTLRKIKEMHTRTRPVSSPNDAPSRQHQLVAEIAVSGLAPSSLTPNERADFYEGLSTLLPEPGAEAAKYAATCIRESQRAEQEILNSLRCRNGGA
jgi:hypothetical protein